MRMICGKPATCPHGSDLMQIGPWSIYADHCRVIAAYLGEWRFWCGEEEMCKPQGVSLTERDYLAAWSEALEHEYQRWLKAVKTAEDARNFEAAHAEALILNAGNDLYDEAVRLNNISDGLARLAVRYAESVQAMRELDAMEHAEYLGEVPWSDRVDD